MRNYISPGKRIRLVTPYAVASGGGMLVGAIFAVAVGPAAQGDTVECTVRGVFDLPKAAGAVTLGEVLYWDDAAKDVTTTAADNTKIGYAILPAAAGDATVRVSLTNQV